MKKFYVGFVRNGRHSEAFESVTIPTVESHGARFAAVVGPFRTLRGALFMRDHGISNPHCLSVADAERLAAREAMKKRTQLKRHNEAMVAAIPALNRHA